MLEWTKNRVIDAMLRWSEIHDGKPAMAMEWAREDVERAFPSRQQVTRIFGSWNAAIEAAGFEPKKYGGDRKLAKKPKPKPKPKPPKYSAPTPMPPSSTLTSERRAAIGGAIRDSMNQEFAQFRSEMEKMRNEVVQLRRAFIDIADDHAEAMERVRIMQRVDQKLDSLPTSKQQQAALMHLGKVQSAVAEVRKMVEPTPAETSNGNGHHEEESRGIIARLFG